MQVNHTLTTLRLNHKPFCLSLNCTLSRMKKTHTNGSNLSIPKLCKYKKLQKYQMTMCYNNTVLIVTTCFDWLTKGSVDRH